MLQRGELGRVKRHGHHGQGPIAVAPAWKSDTAALELTAIGFSLLDRLIQFAK